MTNKFKEIVDARKDSRGNITHVLFKGNKKFTPSKIAIPIAERGEVINTHVVHPKSKKVHLRTNRDPSSQNNLDEMANS